MRSQNVRFRGPGLTLRRFATLTLYAGAVFAYGLGVTRYLGLEVELAEMEEVVVEAEDSEEEVQGGLFIPMTWLTKMPRTYYKRSDPEWQEFVKISNDKPRLRKVLEKLVQKVFKSSTQHPAVNRLLGKDAKVGKWWLDISYPDAPPQEFEWSGLEFGDGFIAWSRQRIDPETQERLARILWPKAMIDSTWAVVKVLAGVNYRRAKQALGWEEKDPFSPEERFRHAQQQSSERNQVRKAQMDPDGTPGSVVGTPGSADTQRPSSGDSSKTPWLSQIPLPLTTAMNDTDIPLAKRIFRSTLSKQWNQKEGSVPPRGTFIVQGLIEVRGSRGRIQFDVLSCYDPKTGDYVVINCAVRTVKLWRQGPKGGP